VVASWPAARSIRKLLVVTAFAVPLCATSAAGARLPDYTRQAYNVLPPGQAGLGGPSANTTDQLELYDALTPLRSNVGKADLARYFKAADFGLNGLPQRRSEDTGRPGLTIVRDSFWVPHITGRTRADVMFGSGWVAAEDRGLVLETLRGPGLLAALDAPNLDPLTLALAFPTFSPSGAVQREGRQQARELARSAKGRQIIRDGNAYVAGLNAYYRRTNNPAKPWTREEVAAVGAVVGGAILGGGGGNETGSAEVLQAMQRRFGGREGARVWQDFRSGLDAETPTTTTKRFVYMQRRGIDPRAVAIPDAGSLVMESPSGGPTPPGAAAARAGPPHRASNFLTVGRPRSATGRPLFVSGPQTGYFFPEVLLEMDLHGGGLDVRGVAFPGIPYVAIGRAKDYAWSATSGSSDLADQRIEELCAPHGARPGRRSTGYRFKGRCRPMDVTNLGKLTLSGKTMDVIRKRTVHGTVVATATVRGKPVAVTTQRSVTDREVLSARALADLDANKVHSAADFARVMNQMEFSFNWNYADDRDIAWFHSGRYPRRAAGVDPDLPSWGTGQWEWRGFLSRSEHPQAIDPRGGLLLSWNNKPAPGWRSADSNYSFQSVYRVDLLRAAVRRRGRHTLATLTAAMNYAATQDLRGTTPLRWALEVLATPARGGTAIQPRERRMIQLLQAWHNDGAPRLDLDNDGKIDAPGVAIMDGWWARLTDAVFLPSLGSGATAALERMQRKDNEAANDFGSAYQDGWYGYVDKDLRRALGKKVRSPYSRTYCGRGSLGACRQALLDSLTRTGDELQTAQGADPTAWRSPAGPERIPFQPGLLGRTMRWTNRPTFQQLMEFSSHRPR
jgi:acyl-homoserine lactone acylase PvdQ